jgi:hypothetical protein
MPKKEPNLELPSFGFRRRKQTAVQADQEPVDTAEPEPAAPEEPVAPEPARPEPEAPEPGAPARATPEEPEPETAILVEEAEETRWMSGTDGIEVTSPVARRRRPSLLTRVPGSWAAAGAGLVCGLVGIVLTIGALRGCEAVRGVGSCGGIGVFALLAILVVEVLIGATLLTACRVRDAVSTSLLGVGVAAVVIVLFLLGSLGDWWMVVVVPLVTAAGYVFSWWVTSRFVEVSDDDRHR